MILYYLNTIYNYMVKIHKYNTRSKSQQNVVENIYLITSNNLPKKQSRKKSRKISKQTNNNDENSDNSDSDINDEDYLDNEDEYENVYAYDHAWI